MKSPSVGKPNNELKMRKQTNAKHNPAIVVILVIKIPCVWKMGNQFA